MNASTTHKHSAVRSAFIFTLLLLLGLLAARQAAAGVANIERISLGSNSLESNGSSYYAWLSRDSRYVIFESYTTNWAPDQDGNDYCYGNCIDLFLRDRQTNQTIKITNGYDGRPTDEDSFHPMITEDGRYVFHTSYATNLVPNDTNRDPWVRNGLDVFVYDRITGQTERVSLNWAGEQIYGNSVGVISGDGNLVVISTDGDNILMGEANRSRITNMYLRDWRTGAMERITADMNNGGFPNGIVGAPQVSYDGRYVIYISEATNLSPDDSLPQPDVMLYDHVTKETTLVSKPAFGGASNGESFKAAISSDGRYVVFKSDADNLVAGDTNGTADIFRYTVATGEIIRVSVSSTGEQSNGFSKDASICGDGSVISFTSDATNLVPGDTNGQRDVFFRNIDRGLTSVATVNGNGVWGNGKAHRSFLSPDCKYIAYATDADNVLPADTNGIRDIFLAKITWPADFSQSTLTYPSTASPGETVVYRFTIRNTGTEAAVATFIDTIPANATFVPSSEVGGVSFNSGSDQVSWSGSVAGESEVTIGFSVQIDSPLSGFVIIENDAQLSGDGQVRQLYAATALNALNQFLPALSAR